MFMIDDKFKYNYILDMSSFHILRHSKLEIASAIQASNEWKI